MSSMALGSKRKRKEHFSSRKSCKIMLDNELANAENHHISDRDQVWEDPPIMDLSGESQAHTGMKVKKPPSGEELRAIKNAADLFQSNSFKLQIEALLPNVRPRISRIPPLERFLLVLHPFLMSLPSEPPQHPLVAAHNYLNNGVSIPYSIPLPTEDTNWKVAFEKPSDITLVGSWANKISVKGKDGGKFGVDLAVEMPECLFQEKDYLNGRFFHKRAFYLATIATRIRASQNVLNVDLFYGCLSRDPRLTILILRPRKDDSQNDFTKLNAQINIIPVLPSPSPLPLHRLSPSHSNIRVAASDISDNQTSATPLYNTAVLTTISSKYDLLFSHTLKQSAPAFADALSLLRVWANQRGYSEGGHLCIQGFEGRGSWWSALLGFLIIGEEPLPKSGKTQRKPLGKAMSSYQLFKAALNFLAKHDFARDHIFLKSQDGHRYPPDEYQGHHEAVFINSSSAVNLLSGVPLTSLDMLRHDAQKTLEALNHASISGDPFADVFLTDHRNMLTRFDSIVRVDLSSAKVRKPSLQQTLDCGSSFNALIKSISTLLRRALGNRSRAIALLHARVEARPVSQPYPPNINVIYIGLIHDAEHAFRLVDHGPPAEEPDQSAINSFRDLWGNKAELRRFKDGRIVESVVWDVKTSDERAQVPVKVVKHILHWHLGIPENAIQTWQTSFDSVLKLPNMISQLYLSSGASVGFKAAINSFDALVKGIKALEDELPLAILNISAVSENLRYTSVFTPVALPSTSSFLLPDHAQYLSPMEIILEFEKSSRWPDDLRAIQNIKVAFLERISTVLMTSMKGLRASVVLCDGVNVPDIQDKARLEIITSEGWAFTARIWHDREATLLDRIINNKSGVPPHVTTKIVERQGKVYHDALEAKEVYARRFIHAPRHHRAIASLCHQFSAYAGTVRLVKRWLASHWLLHGHISEEVVEIICASFFVHNSILTGDRVAIESHVNVPGSKERGFSLVVKFLQDWQWEDGLFVPLYGTGSPNNLDLQTPTSVGSWSGVWNVSTEADGTGRVWTSRSPDLTVAHRVRALAKATCVYLQSMEHGNFNVNTMFIHPAEDYDFVIQLNSAILPRYFQNITADLDSLVKRDGKDANLQNQLSLRPGFDPACQLFDDLKKTYEDTLKIFYDPFGGDKLGAIWDPSVKKPRQFRVLGGFSSTPSRKQGQSKDKGLVTLNESSVLNEIERLGSGLIKAITLYV